MKRLGIKIVLVAATLGLSSCNKGGTSSVNNSDASKEGSLYSSQSDAELNPADYISWCRDKENGLQKSKEIEELTYSVQYKPGPYIACLEEQSRTMPADTLAKKLSELEGLDYFDFKIEITSGAGELLKHNVPSSAEYNQRVNYFAFDMQKDIKLVRGRDTLDCKLFHFERAYDVAPFAVFLLGFPKVNGTAEPVEFFYQDNVFHKGIIKFTYSPETFSRIPKLKTI
jgi:hypothetical protein